MTGIRAVVLAMMAALGACTPTLDWREVRPEGSGAVALFPCKPSVDARMVTLEGTRVRMSLAVCRAGNVSYALAFANAGDPARVTPALAALRAASVANLGALTQGLGSMRVEGMTPNPQAERVRFIGKLPGGEAVTQEAGFFAKGTWVFQATVMGARLDPEAADIFFDSLRLPV